MTSPGRRCERPSLIGPSGVSVSAATFAEHEILPHGLVERQDERRAQPDDGVAGRPCRGPGRAEVIDVVRRQLGQLLATFPSWAMGAKPTVWRPATSVSSCRGPQTTWPVRATELERVPPPELRPPFLVLISPPKATASRRSLGPSGVGPRPPFGPVLQELAADNAGRDSKLPDFDGGCRAPAVVATRAHRGRGPSQRR